MSDNKVDINHLKSKGKKLEKRIAALEAKLELMRKQLTAVMKRV